MQKGFSKAGVIIGIAAVVIIAAVAIIASRSNSSSSSENATAGDQSVQTDVQPDTSTINTSVNTETNTMSTSRADLIKISQTLFAKYAPGGGSITPAMVAKMTPEEQAGNQQVVDAYKEIVKKYDANLDGKIDTYEAVNMSNEDYNFAHQLFPGIKTFQKPR